MPEKLLNEIQAGETVELIHRNGFKIIKVDRVTKTQIVIRANNATGTGAYDLKFNRETGMEVGGIDSFYRRYTATATEERKQQVRALNKRNNQIQKITNFNFEKLTNEQVNEISGLLEKYKV